MIPPYGAVGAAWAAVISESSIAIGLSYHFYKLNRKLYFLDILKLLIFALISCLIGYLFMIHGIHPLICGTISVLIFVLINFILKTITVTEIKGYFAK